MYFRKKTKKVEEVPVETTTKIEPKVADVEIEEVVETLNQNAQWEQYKIIQLKFQIQKMGII